jgi:hypothetical protein
MRALHGCVSSYFFHCFQMAKEREEKAAAKPRLASDGFGAQVRAPPRRPGAARVSK